MTWPKKIDKPFTMVKCLLRVTISQTQSVKVCILYRKALAKLYVTAT